MEKHGEPARPRSSRDVSAGRAESTRKRLQEPPKFYSKNYLKRYNHGEVRAATAMPQQPPRPPSPSQSAVKKSSRPVSPSPQSAATQSQLKNVGTDPTVITISSTILKLTEDGEVVTSERDASTQSRQPPAEISKNENSINPYNRLQGPRLGSPPAAAAAAAAERDYRYSLVNAMSSVKSSYFKCAADTGCDGPANEQHRQPPADDELSCAEWSRHEGFKKIKSKVEEAVKRHKVFLIRGELPRLKEALEERGWVQKYEPSRTRSLPYGSVTCLEAKSLGDVRLSDGSLNERALTFALLRNAPPDFIWDCRNDFVEWDRGIAANVLLNRFHKPSLYTSKLGMAHVLQEAHWLHETNVADVLFPRSYNPSRELAALVRDFRRCAALAVLRRFVDRMRNFEGADQQQQQQQQQQSAEMNDEKSDDGYEVPLSLDRIEFALRCCEGQVAEYEHQDIDSEIDNETGGDDAWHIFFEDCDRLLYKTNGMDYLPKNESDRLDACYKAAQIVLEKLKALDPQFMLNGERNIWIVKPSNLCCGSGIFMTHDLKTILRKVENKPRDYYIVQKYIERPFLVYGTKFDIRQWFLVTSTFPMTIYSFKEALLRLSSKPYTFATYHEAIHICNTAVQERYDYERRRRRNRCSGGANAAALAGDELGETPSVRDQGWDCHKLNEYLKSVGYEGEPYYEKIYPKMSQAIVLTMLAAQDFMDRRRCSFELYGADFMVMEDLSVWLIEINTNPRMHPPSSRITQRLYGSVLDSLVKVIMDLPQNPCADTGGFELVYRQAVPESQPYLGPCLFAFGKSVTLHEAPAQPSAAQARKKACAAERASTVYNPWAKQYRAWTAPPTVERPRSPKVVDFIAYLNNAPAPSQHADENPAVREAVWDRRGT